MKRIMRAIAKLIKSRARHRAGFVLADLSVYEVISHLDNEILELEGAVKGDMPVEDILEEILDVLLVLLHLAMQFGMDARSLRDLALKKLALRFPNAD